MLLPTHGPCFSQNALQRPSSAGIRRTHTIEDARKRTMDSPNVIGNGRPSAIFLDTTVLYHNHRKDNGVDNDKDVRLGDGDSSQRRGMMSETVQQKTKEESTTK